MASAPRVRFDLPAGLRMPAFSHTVITVDRRSGTLTVTASAARATLRVTIARASVATLAGGSDLSSELTLGVPAFGQDVRLSGSLRYNGGQAAVSLAGSLARAVVLAPDVATLSRGATITLNGAGLRVTGPAIAGPPGHQLAVTLSGPVRRGPVWSLRVGQRAASTVPALVPGLRLAPGLSGTVTSTRDGVSFDVRAHAAGPWTPKPGFTLTGGQLEFADRLPDDWSVAAPALARHTPWADVTGNLRLTAGPDRGLAGHGTVAVNLSTGAAIVTGHQSGALSLSGGSHPVTLRDTSIGGSLTVGRAGGTGHVGGTGLVSAVRSGGRTVLARGTVSLTSGGRLAVRYHPGPAPPARPSPAGTPASTPSSTPAARPASHSAGQAVPASGTAGSYTLSSSVLSFIDNALGIPLGSATTISGSQSGSTLTLTVGAPGQLPVSLPAGITAPVLGQTTVTVDESANTITLNSTATAGVTADLTVTIANASASLTSADVTGSLTIGAIPFFGSAASLQGTVTDAAGAASASLTGSLTTALPIAGGAVTLEPGSSLTLATGSGLAVSGTAAVGSSSTSFQVQVTGILTDLKNWSLAVSETAAQAWQPLSTLTIQPDFTGSITDQAGTVGFDLTAASVTGTSVLNWSPGSGATFSVSSLQVSNQAPGDGVSCAAAVKAGDVWIDATGTFSYSPANLGLSGQGCVDLSGPTFQITTSATGTLLPGNPAFSLSQAGLTATGGAGSFSVTGTASLSVAAPGGSVSGVSAAVSFGSGGVIAAASLSDLGALSSNLSGSGTVYISSTQVTNFAPASYGLTGAAFPASIPLPPGVTVTYSGQLPQNVTAALSNVGVTVPPKTVLAVASLGSSGFLLSLDLNFGSGTGGLQVVSASSGTAFYLDDVTFSLALGTATSVTLAGSGDLYLPQLYSGGAASSANVTLSASFQLTPPVLNLSISATNVMNAFGVQGLDVASFGGEVGISSDDPSLSLNASGIKLPDSWDTTIGFVPGAQITLASSISLTQPLLDFSINPGAGQSYAITPLALAFGPAPSPGQQTLIDSFEISSAQFYIAPFGGSIAGQSFPAGLAVSFSAKVDNDPVTVAAAVNPNLPNPSLTASASAGSYMVGPVTIGAATFQLDISPTSYQIGFSGSFASNGITFAASIHLALGNSANGAWFSLQATAGLPSYVQISGALSGSVSGDGGTAQLAASGSGSFVAGGQTFGSVSFSFALPGGGLSWSDYTDSITAVTGFLQNAGAAASTIVSALQSLGYSEYDINNALGSVGDYGQTVLNSLETGFGAFSNVYYDIWTYTSSGQLLVLDVANGSQARNASIDTWTWNNGYNQDWAFVQSPYSGWYEIVSRGSGQCLSVDNNSLTAGTGLVQYPCYGAWSQLWYLGSISLNTTYGISNANSGQVIDVQNAYPWAGGTVDQWPWNGGWNQQFWLTNSGN